jgi:chitinase
MLKISKTHGVFWTILMFCCLLTAAQNSNTDRHIIAYYTGDGKTIQEYPVAKLSHIILSFLAIRGDTLTFKNEAQRQTLIDLVALKKTYPSLKILVSIGGWGGCAPCSELFASATHRENFARSTLELFKSFGADGIDLDWEYPTIEGYPGHVFAPHDKEHFTELIKTLRSTLGPTYVLSFAAGGFDQFLEEAVDWPAIMPHLDFVNLMTYDLTSGVSPVTGHHTPLHSNPKQKQSTSNCVEWLLRQGIPARKLIVGAAFYARVWEGVEPVENGLYQSGTFKQGVNFKNFETFFEGDTGFTYYFDQKSKAPYYYHKQKKLFATFDDFRSIKAKMKYIRQKDLGGIMFWQLSQDKPQNGLVDLIYSLK